MAVDARDGDEENLQGAGFKVLRFWVLRFWVLNMWILGVRILSIWVLGVWGLNIWVLGVWVLNVWAFEEQVCNCVHFCCVFYETTNTTRRFLT